MFLLIILPSNFKLYKKLSPADLAFIVLFLSYLFFILKTGEIKKYISIKVKKALKNSLIRLMILLLILMVVSTIYASNKAIALNESVRFLSYIMIGFLIISELNTKHFFSMIVFNYILISFLLNILGLIQYFTGIGISTTVNIVSNTLRLESTFGNPNSFGAYIVLALFPTIMIFIKEKNSKLKTFYGVQVVLSLITLILTYSRNSWLAFFVGILIITIMYSWKFIFIIIAGGGISLFIPSIMGRVKQFTDMSQNMSRINIWKIAIKMIKDHPIRGVGNGNFSVLYDSYVEKYPELWMEFVTAFPTHNAYLKVFSELGVFGLVIFLSIIFNLMKTMIYLNKKLKGNFKNFYMGFFVSCCVMLILNIFDNIFFVPQIALPFWIMVFVGEYIKDNMGFFNN